MSSPIIWGPSGAKYIGQPPGSPGDVLTIQDSAQNLVFAPASGGGAVSFTLVNNQSSPADVTGFLVDSSTDIGFSSQIAIHRTSASTGNTLDNTFFDNVGLAASNIIQTIAVTSNENVLLGGNFTSFNNITLGYAINLMDNGTANFVFNANTGAISTGAGAGFNNVVRVIKEDSSGKLLFGGTFTSYGAGLTRNRLVRLNSSGTEDAAFYANMGTAFASNVYDCAIDSSDRIVVVSQGTFDGNSASGIVRLNDDGTEDTAFTTNLGTGANGDVVAVAINSVGKIVIGGQFTDFNGTTLNYLARLNSDGTLDTTFNTNLGTGFDQGINGISIDSNDNIFVTGQFTTFNGNTRNYMVKLNDDGTENGTFATNLGTGFNAVTIASAIDSSDRVYVTGTFTALNGNTRNYFVRLANNGTDDSAFYTTLGTAFNAYTDAVALDSRGRILIGGNFSTFNGNTINRIVRLNSYTDLVMRGQLNGYFKDGEWNLSLNSLDGDDVGVTLSMTALGQLQYTSSNLQGTSSQSEMRFVLTQV